MTRDGGMITMGWRQRPVLVKNPSRAVTQVRGLTQMKIRAWPFRHLSKPSGHHAPARIRF